MCLLNIKSQIYSPFAVIRISTDLHVAVQTRDHSASGALGRSGTRGQVRRLGVKSVLHFIPEVFSEINVRAPDLPHSVGQAMCSWRSLGPFNSSEEKL